MACGYELYFVGFQSFIESIWIIHLIVSLQIQKKKRWANVFIFEFTKYILNNNGKVCKWKYCKKECLPSFNAFKSGVFMNFQTNLSFNGIYRLYSFGVLTILFTMFFCGIWVCMCRLKAEQTKVETETGVVRWKSIVDNCFVENNERNRSIVYGCVLHFYPQTNTRMFS